MKVEKVYFGGRMWAAEDLRGEGKIGGTATPAHRGIRSPYPELSGMGALMTAFALSNDAAAGTGDEVVGDPTEIAFYVAARENGFEKKRLEGILKRVGEVPFDSERKCMTTVHKISRTVASGDLPPSHETDEEEDTRFVSFTKGAVEVILGNASDAYGEGGLVPADVESIREAGERMASEGLRVLAVGMRNWAEIPAELIPDNLEKGLTILGLAGMMDPPREEAANAVSVCRDAGIKPVMITGDHPLTASAIAKRVGILADDKGSVITGGELAGLSVPELEERIDRIAVYARVAPEQKLKIVKALQDRGQFVAMTGDGVNDAPALKRADIGVAMGVTGTDVAKEAADMVLLDDNFATIVNAVKEGRKIYDNIRKFVKYLLTTNSGEVWTLLLAPTLGLPVPLFPIHILWINLMTDGLPALALSVEPAEGSVMKRPPRSPGESIFAHGLGLHALWVGLLMAGVVIAVQFWSIRHDGPHWQTMVFTVLCLTQLGHVLAIRSERQSLFTMGLFSNIPLLGAVVLTFGLQMATVYVPFLNAVFKTQPLTLQELLFTLALSTIVFFAVETEKLLRRRKG